MSSKPGRCPLCSKHVDGWHATISGIVRCGDEACLMSVGVPFEMWQALSGQAADVADIVEGLHSLSQTMEKMGPFKDDFLRVRAFANRLGNSKPSEKQTTDGKCTR